MTRTRIHISRRKARQMAKSTGNEWATAPIERREDGSINEKPCHVAGCTKEHNAEAATSWFASNGAKPGVRPQRPVRRGKKNSAHPWPSRTNGAPRGQGSSTAPAGKRIAADDQSALTAPISVPIVQQVPAVEPTPLVDFSIPIEIRNVPGIHPTSVPDEYVGADGRIYVVRSDSAPAWLGTNKRFFSPFWAQARY